MNQSGIDPDRITLKNYEGGHMMYLPEATLEAMSKDLRKFFGS